MLTIYMPSIINQMCQHSLFNLRIHSVRQKALAMPSPFYRRGNQNIVVQAKWWLKPSLSGSRLMTHCAVCLQQSTQTCVACILHPCLCDSAHVNLGAAELWRNKKHIDIRISSEPFAGRIGLIFLGLAQHTVPPSSGEDGKDSGRYTHTETRAPQS